VARKRQRKVPGRRFSRARLAAVVALVRKRCPKIRTLGALMHAVFRVDLTAFRDTGRSLTGATWRKGPRFPIPGPKRVPKHAF
jgi:hypothetical protein